MGNVCNKHREMELRVGGRFVLKNKIIEGDWALDTYLVHDSQVLSTGEDQYCEKAVKLEDKLIHDITEKFEKTNFSDPQKLSIGKKKHFNIVII